MNSNFKRSYEEETLFEGALNARLLAEGILRQIDESTMNRIEEVKKLRNNLLASMPPALLGVKMKDLANNGVDINALALKFSQENVRSQENKFTSDNHSKKHTQTGFGSQRSIQLNKPISKNGTPRKLQGGSSGSKVKLLKAKIVKHSQENSRDKPDWRR